MFSMIGMRCLWCLLFSNLSGFLVVYCRGWLVFALVLFCVLAYAFCFGLFWSMSLQNVWDLISRSLPLIENGIPGIHTRSEWSAHSFDLQGTLHSAVSTAWLCRPPLRPNKCFMVICFNCASYSHDSVWNPNQKELCAEWRQLNEANRWTSSWNTIILLRSQRQWNLLPNYISFIFLNTPTLGK